MFETGRYIKPLFLSVTIVSCLISGCGRPSYEEREAKREAARQKQEQEKERVLTETARNYNATLFPPKSIKKVAFTYELQQFFKDRENRRILFKGYLEDIEDRSGGVKVEFSASMSQFGDDLLFGGPPFLFRLNADLSQVRSLFSSKRPDPILQTIRYFGDPDYLVIAEIQSLNRVRRYEISGSRDTEVEIKMRPRYVAVGQLIDIVRFSIGDKASQETQ